MNRPAQAPTLRSRRRRARDAAAGLWQGWRGFLRLSAICVLAFVLGMVLAHQVEQRWVAPACQAHAASHGLVYREVVVHGLRSELPGPHCLFGTVGAGEASGSRENSRWLQHLVGFFPGFWIDFAVCTEITVPVLAVLLAGLWSAPCYWRAWRLEPARFLGR